MIENKYRSPITPGIFILGIIALFLGYFAGSQTITTSGSFGIAVIIAMVGGIITFLNPSAGLYFLIVAVLFSPEIPITQVPGRKVVVRYDDILLIFIFFTWFASKAIYKEIRFLKSTPIDKQILFFVFVTIFATAKGVIGTFVYPLKGFFYVLKMIEYFMLYYMVVNNIKSKNEMVAYLWMILFVCAAVSIFGLSQIDKVGRVTAPFEGEQEPNTFGGYFMLMFGLIWGLLVYKPKEISVWLLRILIGLMIVPYLYTLSRGSYLAWFPALIVLILFAERGKKRLPIFILVVSLLCIPYLPDRVKDRVYSTFQGRVEYDVPIAGEKVKVDPSSAARIEKWKEVMEIWAEYPLFGLGVTGAGFIDGQFQRTIAELGAVGLFAIILLFKGMYNIIKKLYLTASNKLEKGLALGFLTGFAGLIVHAMTANTFFLVRIMGPFWFLFAMIVALLDFKENEDKIPDEYETYPYYLYAKAK